MEPHQILPVLFPAPTRREIVRVNLAFTPSQTNQHFHELETLLGENRVPVVCSGDTLKFNYTFGVDYFGKIEACLKALTTILEDKTVGIESTVEEFHYGESLIMRVAARLRDVQIAMEKRRNPPPPKSFWRRLIERWLP